MSNAPSEPLDDLQLHHGWVAMLDALGWKGMWKNHKPIELITLIQHLRDGLTSMGASMNATFSPKQTLRMETAFLSDTLVLATWAPNQGSPGMPPPLFFLSYCVAGIVRAAARSTIPINFRGAIAKGDFLIRDNIILGPAVDEAAGCMEKADAALVWFSCSVDPDPRGVGHAWHFEYDIPMKLDPRQPDAPHSHRARVVNPFTPGHSSASHDAVREGMLAAFGVDPTPSVATKKANTEAFLQEARDATRRHFGGTAERD